MDRQYNYIRRFFTVKFLTRVFFALGIFLIIFWMYFYLTGDGKNNIEKILPKTFLSYVFGGDKLISLWQKSGSYSNFLKDNAPVRSDDQSLQKLKDLLGRAGDAEFKSKIFDLLDEDNFYAWTIHALLANRRISENYEQFNWYKNKTTGKLTLLPWTGFAGERQIYKKESYIFDEITNPIISRIFSYPDFLSKCNLILLEYLKDKKDSKYNWAETLSVKDLKDNRQKIENVFYDTELNYVIKQSGDNSYKGLSINATTLIPLVLENIEVEFFNTSTVPVAMSVITEKGDTVCDYKGDSGKKINVACIPWKILPQFTNVVPPEGKSVSASYSVFKAKQIDYHLLWKGLPDLNNVQKITLLFKDEVTGKKVKTDSGVFFNDDLLSNFNDISLSPVEFVRNHPYFKLINNGLVLSGGAYNLSQNVIIPRGTYLTIEPGVTIHFTNNASVFSYSPVVARGTANNPIKIYGDGSGRGGCFVVADNKEESIFEYAEFSGGGAGQINGVFFSALLAFHNADSIVSHSIFSQAAGDDSLNIKYASSTIVYNKFINNSSDGIDEDWGRGFIGYNSFTGNGGDSMDLGGAYDLLIRNNYISASGDKCISIGERATKPVIFNNVLDGCKIGIEIKDLSTPLIINNIIINNQIGIHAYQKKAWFGDGLPKIYNSIIWNNGKQIVQDQKTKIEVYSSAVEGGYDYENNFSIKPEFNNPSSRDFTNKDNNDTLNSYQKGSSAILEQFLGVKRQTVEVGLTESVYYDR